MPCMAMWTNDIWLISPWISVGMQPMAMVHYLHYGDIIKSAMVSQITSLTIVYSTFYSVSDQSKHQCSASLAFVRGIHRWPVNSPHKRPVTRKCFHLMTSSWVPGRCGSNFKSVVSQPMLWINFMSIFCEIALEWMLQNTFDVKSRLVLVKAWCVRQETITWANVDPDHLASLGQDKLKIFI